MYNKSTDLEKRVDKYADHQWKNNEYVDDVAANVESKYEEWKICNQLQ